ncbi:glucans biosynthesis glucosyltransferase MdoH [Rhodoblastus sp.]|uniref:glucans biosynthesis glucosyltransferase MdoH n=1 Tax=Rhodoblastus sp. TaxID=1962975 RepID=UPI0026107374|nr:glucans biosynthesis glucosyltransferase MdoH [Rhodoblastus sp.]
MDSAPSSAAVAPPAPAIPKDAPIPMPEQKLFRFDASKERRKFARRVRAPWLSRIVTFGGGLALTAWGGYQMFLVIDVGGITFPKWALLVLFVANFSWIALSFAAAIVGFLHLLIGRPKPPALPDKLTTRNAVIMPIYNEAPSRVFGAIQAIHEDVEATGHGASFDWFLLSDSTDPDVWIAEERALIALRRRLGPDARVYYRHRAKNIARKAGNVGDFVSRWGGAYDHMVVLDADSLMTGHAIVTLAATMEADPDAGIIQTLPLIINRNTLFARVQQFAARIYGPVIADGLACWMGRDGNYWGHNAIIRVKAFAAHCGLPHLRGKPPFGGHILSHDFVEAALMRRAGYSVYMLASLPGSYEESPPSLIDTAIRDRRWCQGNLQHISVLPAKGLVPATRQHFATGIMAYLASPLWLAQLLVGLLLVLQAKYIRPEYFSREFTLYPTWPVFDAERSLELFILTMAVLLAPKLFGLIVALFDGPTRRGSGGAIRLVLSTLFEVFMSALLAPIMMLVHSGHVLHILFGFDTGWEPQRRDDGSVPFKSIIRRHRDHVILGVISLVAALLLSPSLAAWMSPTIAGLILAIPLSWGTGLKSVGLAFRRIGLLDTPEERAPPPVATRANALSDELAAEGFDKADGLRVLYQDAEFRDVHEAFLPPALHRARGDISPERAMAIAKLGEARSIDEASAWIQRKERAALMQDRALIALLARLPETSSAAAE